MAKVRPKAAGYGKIRRAAPKPKTKSSPRKGHR